MKTITELLPEIVATLDNSLLPELKEAHRVCRENGSSSSISKSKRSVYRNLAALLKVISR